MSDGTHAITAIATSVAGDDSDASNSLAVTIDSVAPTLAVIGISPDTGSSSTDGVTSSGTVTVSGTIDLADTSRAITVLRDGISVGTVTANAVTGVWSLANINLTEGSHTLTAQAVDTAGNAGISTAFSVIRDATAPATPSVPDLATASDSGASSTDNVTNVTTPIFTGTAEAGSTVTIFSDGVAVGSVVAAGGNYSVTTSSLSSGTHSITAKATDAAGNTSVASSGLSVTIDTTPPGAPSVPDLTAASDSGASNTDNITRITTPTFTGTAEAGSTVTIFSDGVAVGSAVAAGGSYNITTSTLIEGPHSITAEATDAAGNAGAASSALPVAIDTTAPSVAVSISDNVLNASETATVGFAFSEAPTGFALGDTTVVGGTLGNLQQTDATHFTATFTPAPATETAAADVSIVAAGYADTAGNPGTAGSTGSFTVDTIAPAIAIGAVAGDNTVDGSEAATGFAINGTTTDVENGQIVSVTVRDDANNVVDTLTATVTAGAWSAGVTATEAGMLANGSYTAFADVSDAAGNPAPEAAQPFDVVVCFASGTRVLTVTGEVAVENLHIGEVVVGASGTLHPISWIGHRSIDLARHPHPQTVAPIRIRQSALADNTPHRDVLLSPDHAVFVDGKLICARQLINGTTISQDMHCASVDYFHVELDRHAVLLAEGLPAESYLDTGNRGFFTNAGGPVALHPDLTDESDYPKREVASCAPFVWDEPSVRPVWEALAARAAALGEVTPHPATASDPELRIVVNGCTLRPVATKDGLHIFVLRNGITRVRLVSRAGAPTDVRPWLNDRRRLGVCIERIVLRSPSSVHEIPVDHPDLSKGWWEAERNGAYLGRWTDGDAELCLPGDTRILEVRISAGGMSYLVGADAEQMAA